MPRTIDSLSPNQNGSKSGGPSAGDVYRPKDSGPAAGSVVKPEGYQEHHDKPLKSNSGKLRPKKDPRRLILFSLVLAVVAVVAGGVWWYSSLARQKQESEKARAGTRETLSQLDVVKNMSDQDKESFYKQVGPEYAAAKKIGIELDPNSMNDVQALSIATGGSPSGESTAKAFKQLIESRLEIVKKDGYIEGYVYNFWFGNTAIKWPYTSQVPNAGSAQALADDKAYALEKADSARRRLQDGAITSDQLLDELNNDRRLRLVDDPNGSARFAMARPKQAKIENDTAGNQQYFDTLATMQDTGLSQLLTRKYISVYDTTKTPVEAAYQFVQLTKIVSGEQAVRTYEDYLKQAGGWQW